MMSEQLSDIEDGSSQATTNSVSIRQQRQQQQEEEEFWSWKTMSQYARELICLLAFFLTTYATFQNRTQKFSRPPTPIYLFDKNSMVHEYSDGQLSIIQTHVALSELSLVFFYAPWCAESRFAKNTIEELAKQFSDEVYFAAVNCWQPGGECKLQYPRVDSWPVLMAYYPKGLAVQYNGLWNLKSVASFIDKLMNPIQRIETKKDLLRAKLNNYAVVIGFFHSTQLSKKYQIFFQAAVKSLESIHLRGIEFAIITGVKKQFNLTEIPAIEMHSLNSTMFYEENNWTVENIHNWIRKGLNTKNVWVEISGRKSWNLSQHLKKTPTLLTFYQRHYSGNYDDAYYLLQQVAFAYNNCRLNTSSSETDINFIKSLREENKKQNIKLKLKCFQLKKEQQKTIDNEYFLQSQNCNASKLLLTNSNLFESAKNINKHDYCTCNQQYSTIISDQNQYFNNNNDDKKMKYEKGFFKNAFTTPVDTKEPSYLLKKSLDYKCWKLQFVENNTNYSMNHEINANFTGLGCKYNRTLSFVMADSDLYLYMMKSLGVNSQIKNLSKALVFIIDGERESTFQMKNEISVSSLINFIENFHNNLLTRNLRNKILDQNKIYNKSLLNKRFHIKEINSRQLKELIKQSNQNNVILFYSSQCALCNILSRTLLSIGNILKSSNINMYRIDGENNDFSWEYMMDSFPTLLAMPKGREMDARIYPRNIEISSENLLRFILTTLNNRTDRLRLIIEICKSFQAENLLSNCLKNFRIEIINSISDNLQYYRIQIMKNNTFKLNNYYENIIKKLQTLHKIYYLTYELKLKNLKIFQIIIDEIVIFGNL